MGCAQLLRIKLQEWDEFPYKRHSRGLPCPFCYVRTQQEGASYEPGSGSPQIMPRLGLPSLQNYRTLISVVINYLTCSILLNPFKWRHSCLQCPIVLSDWIAQFLFIARLFKNYQDPHHCVDSGISICSAYTRHWDGGYYSYNPDSSA